MTMDISIATCLVVALLQSDEGELRFHPPTPVRIIRYTQSELELKLVSATTTLNEQVFDSHELAEPGTTLTVKQTAEIADAITLVAGESPSSFRRTYERLLLTAAGLGSEPYREEGALKGRTVRFDRPAEGRAWKTVLEGQPDVPEEFLENLLPDRDFLWLLPADPSPPKGKTWWVANEDLLSALSPEGLSPYVYADRGWDYQSWPTIHIVIIPPLPRRVQFWTEAPEGRVLAEYTGHRVYKGDKVAVVSFSFDVNGTRKPPDLLRDMIQGMRWADRGEAEEHQRESLGYTEYGGEGIHWRLEGTGELLWGIEDGHFRHFDLRGEVHVRYDLTWAYDWERPQGSELVGAPQDYEIRGRRQEDWRGKLRMRVGSEALGEDEQR